MQKPNAKNQFTIKSKLEEEEEEEKDIEAKEVQKTITFGYSVR